MNKYSYIALLLAVIIGVGVGHLFTNSSKNREMVKLVETYEQKLKVEQQVAKDSIKSLTILTQVLQDSINLRTEEILNLEHRIEQDGVAIERLRKERKQWTNEEKIDFLNTRYPK